MNSEQLRRRIAATTYRALLWGQNHVAPGIRSLLGIMLMVGGVFGFLPILGFWMFPLGVAFVALDVPSARHHIDRWMVRLARRAYAPHPHGRPQPDGQPEEPIDQAHAGEPPAANKPPRGGDQPTSNQ
ncbi:MAG: hypothetical protein R3E86_14870 [Pseudomonadales bacterium]